MLDHLVEIRKQSGVEEAEEAEPERKERTVTVSKLSEGLGLIEGGVEVSEDIGWNEQGAAATGQGIMRMLACCKQILKEKKRPLSDRLQCWFL